MFRIIMSVPVSSFLHCQNINHFNLLQKLLTSQYTSFMQPLVKLIDPTFNVSNESQKDIENMTVFIGFAFQIAIPYDIFFFNTITMPSYYIKLTD